MFTRKLSNLLCASSGRIASVGSLVSRRTLPVCSVQTNLPGAQIPSDFQQGLGKLLAKTLSKPEEKISVSVVPSARIWRGGNESPTCIIDIWSIGVFDSKRNEKYSKDIFEFVVEKLPISNERIVLLLHPLAPEEAGHLVYEKLLASGPDKK